MSKHSDDLISRSIRFLNQQKEMFGEFDISDTKTQKHQSDEEGGISVQAEELATESQKHKVEEQEASSEIEEVGSEVNEPEEEYVEEPMQLTLQEKIDACTSLEELKGLCSESDELKTDLDGTNLVFGIGNPNADLMIIGEAPGFNEDKQGEPFVGQAGQLLDKIMAAINFKREDIYIANILKHRPPYNRDPKVEERKRSLPFLLKQIELIDPKLILCVGRVSATTLLDQDASLKSMRQKFHPFHGRELMVTYHPAALLRNQQWKRPTWEDVQLLRKKYDELGGQP